MKYKYFILILLFSGCSLISNKPEPKTTENRYNEFPKEISQLKSKASIYWNQHMVPFIESESDQDAAFLIGIVHAHLRLGQMEILRMIAEGRLAEMAGPLLTDIDHSLRTLQIQKYTDEIAENDNPETKIWIANFIKGVNWYIETNPNRPVEYKLFNIPHREWKPRDVYAISRLLSADLTWGGYFQSLSAFNNKEFEQTWTNFLRNGQKSIPSFSNNQVSYIKFLFESISKSGSNTLVLSGNNTITGKAILAGDPHLGIIAPNFWLVAGYKSPSYHCIGMQVPGIPATLLGRNMNIAWGGTNMRSISSHIYELDDIETQKITEKTDTIKIRWWKDKIITLRESPFGTIVSDAPYLKKIGKTLAIKWVGHQPTFEISAFLKGSRASDFESFKSAFNQYYVSGQNMIYADNDGNIGHILAYGQPILKYPEKTLDLIKNTNNPIVSIRFTDQHPFSYNPSQGFIASANNLPIKSDIPYAYQYTGYGRMKRMIEFAENHKVSLDDVKNLQLDSYSDQNYDLNNWFMVKIEPFQTKLQKKHELLFNTINQWDGYYSKSSKGPVAIEIFYFQLAQILYGELYKDKKIRKTFFDGEYWAWDLQKALDTISISKLETYTIHAFEKSIKNFEKYKNWGEMHRLKFGPPQSSIPIIGEKFLLLDIPIDGTSHSLNKSAHTFSDKIHRVSYGSNSRHIHDMGNINNNYFVLLGGQDGWTSSPHNYDQVELWVNGKYFKFPIEVEEVKKEFNYQVNRY